MSYAAAGAINALLAIAGLGLLLSACCCLICFGIESDGERMRRWLRLALIFLSGALLVMALVVAVTVVYRVWFAV
jgi:hypothetical protein